MSTNAVLFSLLAGVTLAGLDATRKRLGESGIDAIAIVLMLTLGMSLAFGAYLGVDGFRMPPAAYLLPLVIVVATNVVANLLFMRSVTVSPLSKTIPFLSAHPVFTALFAIPLLGEFPRPWQWVGIALVVVGALLVNAGGRLSLRQLWADFRDEPGSRMMVIVSAAWALASPFDKRALGVVSIAEHIFFVNFGLSLILFGLLIRRRALADLRRLREVKGPSTAAVLFLLVGVAAQFAAYERTLVASVETIKRMIGLLAALVLGRLFFDEPITRGKLLALALMSAGIALVIV